MDEVKPELKMKPGDTVLVKHGVDLKTQYGATVLSMDQEKGMVEVKYDLCTKRDGVNIDRVSIIDLSSGRPKRSLKKTDFFKADCELPRRKVSAKKGTHLKRERKGNSSFIGTNVSDHDDNLNGDTRPKQRVKKGVITKTSNVCTTVHTGSASNIAISPPVPVKEGNNDTNHEALVEEESKNYLIKKELWIKKGFKSKGNEKWSERRLVRKKYLFDPHGRPRKTFRRMNCKGKTGSIATLFGGQGQDPWPRPKNIPLYRGEANPFIKGNELFVAGRSDWNPWTPCYAGDDGFVTKRIFKIMHHEQKLFHLFLQCADKNYAGHYYGHNAKKKYLYIGRYKRDDECGVEAIKEPYKTFSGETQEVMASLYRRWHKHQSLKIVSPSNDKSTISDEGIIIERVNGDVEQFSKELMIHKAVEIHVEEWERLSREKQDVLVWVEMMIMADYHVNVVPVEFVDYDEDLYQALVDIDATNGEIAEDENELGLV